MAEIDIFIDAAPIDIAISAAQGPEGPVGPAGTTAWSEITGKPDAFPPSAHTHAISDVVSLQTTLNLKAPLASPALTGIPTAPTAATTTNTTQLATTQFVQQELASGVAVAKNLEVYVSNMTGASMPAGTIVYINDTNGNRPTIAKAQANSDANSAQTFGFTKTSIADNGFGFVIVRGELENVNTNGLGGGTQLYLSPSDAGNWTTTKPAAPEHLVYVGIVVKDHPTQGIILVAIQNGYELEELHDVSITAPVSAGQVIKRNAGNTLWINSAIVSADVSDATSSATPNTLVLRDGSGNTSIGTATGSITGNAGTVTSIGNLTGVVKSTNRATSIDDAALSIAKTNGLQTALNGKQAVAITRDTTEGRPIYSETITIADYPMVGGDEVLSFSGLLNGRPYYTSTGYGVYWDGAGLWVIYDNNAASEAWSSAEPVDTPQEVTSWNPEPASSGTPVVTGSAQTNPTASSVGQLLRYGDSAPFEWYVAKGSGASTSWVLLVDNDSVNRAIEQGPAFSRFSLGITAIGDGLATAATESDARTTLGSGATGDQLFTADTPAEARETALNEILKYASSAGTTRTNPITYVDDDVLVGINLTTGMWEIDFYFSFDFGTCGVQPILLFGTPANVGVVTDARRLGWYFRGGNAIAEMSYRTAGTPGQITLIASPAAAQTDFQYVGRLLVPISGNTDFKMRYQVVSSVAGQTITRRANAFLRARKING